MLVKKKASEGKKNGVSYLNGQIKFQGVSLNVQLFNRWSLNRHRGSVSP